MSVAVMVSGHLEDQRVHDHAIADADGGWQTRAGSSPGGGGRPALQGPVAALVQRQACQPARRSWPALSCSGWARDRDARSPKAAVPRPPRASGCTPPPPSTACDSGGSDGAPAWSRAVEHRVLEGAGEMRRSRSGRRWPARRAAPRSSGREGELVACVPHRAGNENRRDRPGCEPLDCGPPIARPSSAALCRTPRRGIVAGRAEQPVTAQAGHRAQVWPPTRAARRRRPRAPDPPVRCEQVPSM